MFKVTKLLNGYFCVLANHRHALTERYAVRQYLTLQATQCLHKCLPQLTYVSRHRYSTAPCSTWEFDVKPFGKFILRTGALASVFVKTIDPQKYPMQNKVFVKVTAVDDGTDDAELTCTAEDSQIILHAEHTKLDFDKKLFSCDVELPIKFDLDLEVEGKRDVAVKGFENSDILMKSDQGNCYLFAVKSGNVDVQTFGGNVVSKSYLQANGSITTYGLGCVLMDRVLGLNFEVYTEDGDIDIKAVYADQSKFTTEAGSVYLKSCHRHSEVSIEEAGKLTVGTLDGDMQANINQGDVDIYFTKHGQVDLNVIKGNMVLKVTDATDTDIDLSASKVTIDADLIFTASPDGQQTDTALKGHIVHSTVPSEVHDQLLGRTRTVIRAHTQQGTISVECKDWLASLNLSGTVDM